MASYEALYGRWCHSPSSWFEHGVARMLDTDLAHDAFEKVKLIQDRLHTIQKKKKIYTDKKVHVVAYMRGEKVLLKVSPVKGMMRFGKNGKLSSSFSPFEILERVGEVAYRLALSPNLAGVHLLFYIFMLRNYLEDKSHVLDCSTMQIDEDLT
nr:uncharacterized protein LOC117273845 [Nicotiana tomentosiformis]